MKINQFNTITTKYSMNQMTNDIASNGPGCADPEFCFEYQGQVFEKLNGHPDDIDFRAILDESDYDYVEDKNLEQILLVAWKTR